MTDKLKWSVWGTERKENKEKWTEPQWSVGYHQPYPHMHNGVHKQREKRKTIFGEIMGEKYQNLFKNKNCQDLIKTKH